MDWVQQFEAAAKANGWTEDRLVAIAAGHLRGAALDWYLDQKDLIERFNHAADANADVKRGSFTTRLYMQYATPERQNRWFYDLHNIAQAPKEKVNDYTRRFQKLLYKVDPEDSMPVVFRIRMYVKGLRRPLARAVMMEEPDTMKKAMDSAKLAEASDYYGQDDTDAGVEALTKQMEKLALNYANLTSALAVQTPTSMSPIQSIRTNNNF